MIRFFLIAAIVFCSGCAATPRVTTDWDPSISWPRLRTYAWLPDPPGHAGDPRLHNALIDARVRRSVERELVAIGLQQVPIERADFFVTYYLALENRVTMRMVAHSYRYRRSGWSERHTTQTTLRERPEGTLLVDFLDRERGLIWRGGTSSRVRRNLLPREREELIDAAVTAILAEFPPTGDCPRCTR